jgi:hypothetical protein
MCAFADHGEHGTGETLLTQLRPGNASPWSKTDHIAGLDAALDAAWPSCPKRNGRRCWCGPTPGRLRRLLEAFLHHITDAGLEYSIGFPAHETVRAAITAIPAEAGPKPGALPSTPTATTATAPRSPNSPDWMPQPTSPAARATRPGPHDWPAGMRVIARRERPHPGAQLLHLTDIDGWRITCFATNTRGPGWTRATLETRHRLRARAEDRIRGLKDTGLRNLPYHDFDRNQIWLKIVPLAADLLAWTQTLAWNQHEPARRWEPKRIRLRILAVAGRIIHTAAGDASACPAIGHGIHSSTPAGPP